jgi:DNA helicase HerA-like ATPase
VSDFGKAIASAYAVQGLSVELGKGVLNGTLEPEADVRFPLKMANRHGLIAGATGTGKTRTLQLIAEQLSEQGVPVFAADVKGDVSGVAMPGDAAGPAATRAAELGMQFNPTGFPTEYLSLGGIGPGVPIRATVSEFGPQLLAKVLEAWMVRTGFPPITRVPQPVNKAAARMIEISTDLVFMISPLS